ncbi:MAG: nucleotide exchange factor GrpE [Rickettsiales bacterium]|nr:nucleotide exchange factor GrpE [Rickettsiales bacterium]
MQENNDKNLQENSSNEQVEEQANPLSPIDEANKKISELENKITDLNDKLLRTLAEIDNVRRRSREDVEKASKYAISNFASDLVVVTENFFLASENAPKAEIEQNPAIKNYADAIVMTEKELLKVLEKNQVKRIYPLNEKFDHNFHEAISQIDAPEGSNAKEGDVLQVIQAGYSIGDRLIRPALVVVAK